MTQFNSATILMPLDEYYDKCVEDKPKIPKKYPGSSRNWENDNRQAPRLNSYKDLDYVEDDENFLFPISQSNCSQLKYEFEEFNQAYEDGMFSTTKNNAQDAGMEQQIDSAQQRMHDLNLTNPMGAVTAIQHQMPSHHVSNNYSGGHMNQRRLNNGNTQRVGRTHGIYNDNRYGQTYQQHRPKLARNAQHFQSQQQRQVKQQLKNAFGTYGGNVSHATHVHSQQVVQNIKNEFQTGKATNTNSNGWICENKPKSLIEGHKMSESCTEHFNFPKPMINNFERIVNNPLAPKSMVNNFDRIINNPLAHKAHDLPGQHMSNFNFPKPMINNFERIVNNPLAPKSMVNNFDRIVNNPLAHKSHELPGQRMSNVPQFPNAYMENEHHINDIGERAVSAPAPLRLADLMNLSLSDCQNIEGEVVARNAFFFLDSVIKMQQESSQNDFGVIQPNKDGVGFVPKINIRNKRF